MIKTETIGWKAWYENGKTYRSTKNNWKNIPRKGLTGFKRFFKLVDEEGNYIVDEASGKSIYYEILIGHKMVTLSVETLLLNRRIPKPLKFGAHMTKEELEEVHKQIEEDQEEPFSDIHLEETQ